MGISSSLLQPTRPQCRAGTGQPRHDGADRQTCDGGDLAIVHVLDFPQDQHLAMILRQPRQQTLQGALLVAVDGEGLRVGRFGDQFSAAGCRVLRQRYQIRRCRWLIAVKWQLRTMVSNQALASDPCNSSKLRYARNVASCTTSSASFAERQAIGHTDTRRPGAAAPAPRIDPAYRPWDGALSH